MRLSYIGIQQYLTHPILFVVCIVRGEKSSARQDIHLMKPSLTLETNFGTHVESKPPLSLVETS